MNYTAKQYSRPVQAYAFISVALALVSLVVFPPLAYVIGLVNFAILAYARLR